MEGGVAGTRHYSAHRAGGGVVLAALGVTAAAAPLMGLDPWSLLNIETGFALFTASSLAGAWVAGRGCCSSQGLLLGLPHPRSQPARFGCQPLHPPMAMCGNHLPHACGCCLQG